MPKINLAILFGGKSSEHNVSRLSAVSIIENVSKEKYNLFLLGINKQGQWFLYDGDIKNISDGSWEENPNNKKAIIPPDPSFKGLLLIDENMCSTVNIDVVIPVFHGRNGEDGTMQGLLQLAGVPFVGCDTCSSAACMDKVITCTMLTDNNIKKPRFFWFRYCDFRKNKDSIIKEIESKISQYPMFVKPANSGSSVGISKAHNKDELVAAIEIAKNEDEKIIVEEAIEGHEVECAVLGNDDPIASITGEIVTSDVFYDYNSKYINNTSELYIPAKISEQTSKEVQSIATKAYKIMGCKGLSRVDFLVDKKTNEVFLNEINTFPGFTSISMYPKLMEHIGISFPELIDRLIDLAMKK